MSLVRNILWIEIVVIICTITAASARVDRPLSNHRDMHTDTDDKRYMKEGPHTHTHVLTLRSIDTLVTPFMREMLIVMTTVTRQMKL